MQYEQHASNNTVLGAPQDWEHTTVPCGALPVTRTYVQDIHHPVMVSFWRPDAQELAALNAGLPVA